jgi:hypothetical protein
MMDDKIVYIRKSICARCDQQCEAFKAATIDYADPKASCPRQWPSRWRALSFGLGDAVAALASPVAAASDSMFGTSLSSCGGCAKRREALNQMVPSIIPTLSP